MSRLIEKSDVSDEELMLDVKDRDDVESFGRLYDRHVVRALGVARSVCRDASRSEDIVQEAFLAVWCRRHSYHPESGSFRGWSMTIVRHAAIDAIRRDGTAGRPTLAPEQRESVDLKTPSPEDQVVATGDAEALAASLARLPEAQSEVITLAFFGELTHVEIAAQLEIPPGTVKGRMRLGLEKLRRQIERAA